MYSDCSPNRIKTAPQTCKSIKNQSFKSTSKFSPTKKSPASTQRNSYEKSCCGHTSRSHYSAFLLDLQAEVRKINGSIPLYYDEKSVFSSIIFAVKQAIEQILLIQGKFTNTDWAEIENFKSNLKIQEAKLKNEAEKLKITARHLEQYDSMLKSKEDQVKSDEKRYEVKLDLLRQEDLFNEELKLKCIQLEQEVRLLKKQKVSAKDVIEGSYISEIDTLKKENRKLREILQNKNNIDDVENFRNKDQLVLNQEKCKLENVKLELEQLKLTIEKEKSKIRGEGKEEESEVAESHSYESEKSCRKMQELDYRECLLIQSEKELSKSVVSIKEQIDLYNKELEEKENNLEELASQNLTKERVLSQKIIDLKLIEDSLNSSRIEIDDFNQLVIPSFENYSQAISQLLADLYAKKQDLLILFERVLNLQENLENKEKMLNDELAEMKNEALKTSLDLDHRKKLLENIENGLKEKEKELNEQFNERIMEISRELEEKLRSVKEKESELECVREDLENEKSENENVAIQLKMAHLELENSRIKQMEKIRLKKEKLRELKEKLEVKLGAKENVGDSF